MEIFPEIDNTITHNFITIIDSRFAQHPDSVRNSVDNPGIPIAREHEEFIELFGFSLWQPESDEEHLYLVRPIPEESGLALARWNIVSGHRVVQYSRLGIDYAQRDYRIKNGLLVKREVTPTPDSSSYVTVGSNKAKALFVMIMRANITPQH